MKTVLKIIAIILILALLAGFITVMVKTDFFRDLGAVELPDLPDLPGTTEDPEPYLEIGGVKYEYGMDLADDSALRVDVKDFEGDFEVNIVPGESFDFKVDGLTYKFPVSLEADWNSVFELQVGEGYFTFNNSNKDLGEILTTACFPEAEVKIFLDASPEVRADRRFRQHGENDYGTVLSAIKKRDHVDINKPIGNLKIADDALYIDTSEMDPEAVLKKIFNYINAKAGERNEF